MPADVKCWCQHCKKELHPSHTGPCPYCGKRGKVHEISISDAIVFHDSINIRQKRRGFGKFMIESIQGWFPGGDPKLKKGVDKVRIIDKERNEYHETVTDAMTGEVIHDEHKPLSQHKHQPKQRTKKAKG